MRVSSLRSKCSRRNASFSLAVFTQIFLNQLQINSAMTEYKTVKEAMKQGSGKVSLQGWVYRERGSSKLKFIVLRDSTDIIQCVLEKDKLGDKKFDVADKVQVETSMRIHGIIKEDKRAPTGYEIAVEDFEVVGASNEFPITKDQSTEFLADNRHLWLRSRRMTAILKIRSTVFHAIDDYFRKEGFYIYHSPCFSPNNCEGGSTVFKVDYFGTPMYLTQSWQLYAEAGIFSLGNIYTIAPSFRAERSKTSRHLTEYWHAEMEMVWNTFEDVMHHAEGVLKFILKEVLDKHQEEFKILERDPKKLEPALKKPFIKMTYTDALKILKEKCKMDVEWGKDLRTLEEEKLTLLYDVPIICTRYPKKVKAFYMMEDPENSEVVLGMDCLAPEGYGEIIGGSQREENAEEIEKRLREQGEDPSVYGWYLDLRKYGSVPHGGFGLGVERVITWICGLDNIKDAIPFPRTMFRFTP